ncbi:MAG: hypothetical protein Q7J25_02390 [Vicinamibacterales bacterium]|nr:hypothetical protein [Vicinamibacterales bacterium]
MGLASRGQRDFGSGLETIVDPTELARVRRQARAVHVKSFLFAVAMTTLVYVISAVVS